MERILEQSLLFDFYGELLTEHQRDIYEDFVSNDLSLGEIAESRGISRQAVYDIVRRCDRLLEGYERRLHLVAKFGEVKRRVALIRARAERILDASAPETEKLAAARAIEILSGEIIDTF